MPTFRDLDLRRLASLTKYPSIETFHALGAGGRPSEEHELPPGEVLVTEKIDGLNAALIFFGGEFIIRSREELLTHSGDLVRNAEHGIVDLLLPHARRLQWAETFADGGLHVLFGEMYGGRIGTTKHYTATGSLGFRLFDALTFSFLEAWKILAQPPEKIAGWRDHGGQPFMDEMQLERVAADADIQLTPRISRWSFNGPESPLMMYERLTGTISETHSVLDGASGPAEGVVIRTPDRRWIRKVRFDQYRKIRR